MTATKPSAPAPNREMTPSTKRNFRRSLLGFLITAGVVLCIYVVAIATPAQYRVSVWAKLPVLDHRLLPHLSALVAGVFGAFSDRCRRFIWAACNSELIAMRNDILL